MRSTNVMVTCLVMVACTSVWVICIRIKATTVLKGDKVWAIAG